VLLLLALPAHGTRRPAYLELHGEAPEYISRVIGSANARRPAALSRNYRQDPGLTPVATRRTDGAAADWRVTIEPRRTVVGRGLEGTMTDVLVRAEFADGTQWSKRLTPAQPEAVIPAKQSGWSVAGEYFKLGVEHILLGIDHLLFVLTLLIITVAAGNGQDRHRFCGDGIMLARPLGFAYAAGAVEAVIALSIVLSPRKSCCAGRHRGLQRAPWIVAFASACCSSILAGAWRDRLA
jgi:hypothetical protein